KIISDNLHEAIPFEPHAVQKMIERHAEHIFAFAQSLQALCKEIHIDLPIVTEPYFARWHFTATEKHQLRRLLKRLACLQKSPLSLEEFSNFGKARDVLAHLEKTINALPLHFHV